MEHGFAQWYKHNVQDESRKLSEQLLRIRKHLCKSYTLYDNLLLLPAEFVPPSLALNYGLSLSRPSPWDDSDLPMTRERFDGLLESLAVSCSVTHIAITRPIPPRMEHHDEARESDENILRSPFGFTPVYGDFGPASLLSSASTAPTEDDFGQAFWARAKQNGIWQVWAPRWTMFSRGNISEKARILTLPSVAAAVDEGGCTAVDLFAGIGYFAFSYAKAGVRRTLCWDLNPWSVEGLRRGATKNRWSVHVSTPSTRSADDKATETVHKLLEAENAAEDPDLETRLLVFNEHNERAPERIAALRHLLPPIRHVNCGMLPSSRQSLQLAAAVLDPQLGGWIHVHENCGENDIESMAESVRREFEAHWRALRGQEEVSDEERVQLEFVNKLKSYAPRVWHCVVDLYVPPPESERKSN